MREEWNKGYEKGRDDYCCNGDCNQGRDCPLRTKTLTDEEIDSLIMEVAEKPTDEDLYDFARAILRKAQEK
jgi:hypothetical protein